jgi:hypothetical protein
MRSTWNIPVHRHDAEPVQREHRLPVLAVLTVRRAQLRGQARSGLQQQWQRHARSGAEHQRHGQQQRGGQRVERRLPRAARLRRGSE